ncbi:MAG: oligosaccharide flippase family protein [Candidatus Paceibacterota bacterium]
MFSIKSKIYNILRWSGKHLKTDMVYFAKGGFWLTASQVISNLLSFGLSIAYANLLSQQTFGTYKYILSAYGLISTFILPGLTTAITHSVSRHFDGSLEFGFRKKISWSVLAGLVSLLVSAYYLMNNDITLSVSFFIVGIFLPIMETFGLYSSLLEGKKLFRERVIYEIKTNIISAIFIVLALFLTKNLFVLLVVYFSSNGLARAFFYFLTVKKFKANNQIDDKMLDYSKSLSIFQIASNATQYLDKIFLFTILGAPEVAIFTFASAMPSRIKYLFRFTGTIAFPKFTNRPLEEIKKTLPKKLAFLGLSILAVIIIYILLAPFIFKYLFPKYLSAVLLSQIIALTSIYSITYPISSCLTAHKKVKELFIISTSSFVFQIIFMLVFIPIYGIWGAVIGTAANRLVIFITSFYFLNKIKD